MELIISVRGLSGDRVRKAYGRVDQLVLYEFTVASSGALNIASFHYTVGSGVDPLFEFDGEQNTR